MNNEMHYSDRAEMAMRAAAAKAGHDISNISVKYATLDATWGDRMGLVVLGGDQATRERCAAFLLAWCAKYFAGRTSYECQNAVRAAGNVTWLTHKAGAGVFPADPPDYYSAEKAADYRARSQPGVAVSTVYYPCAE